MPETKFHVVLDGDSGDDTPTQQPPSPVVNPLPQQPVTPVVQPIPQQPPPSPAVTAPKQVATPAVIPHEHANKDKDTDEMFVKISVSAIPKEYPPKYYKP